jgi:ABC-type methionine transport system ATPase subunit
MPKVAFDALMQQISTLQATVDRLTAIIEEKNQIILNQNRARFGQSSEKRTYLLADGQLSMFEQTGKKVNILSANTKSVGGIGYGQMVLELPKGEADQELIISFFRERGLSVQEVTRRE